MVGRREEASGFCKERGFCAGFSGVVNGMGV